jgi:hypothetical protein
MSNPNPWKSASDVATRLGDTSPEWRNDQGTGGQILRSDDGRGMVASVWVKSFGPWQKLTPRVSLGVSAYAMAPDGTEHTRDGFGDFDRAKTWAESIVNGKS